MSSIAKLVILMGLVAVVAWSAQYNPCRAAEARAKAIAKYRLDSKQVKVYDECLDTLAQKRLKKGGRNESFCGCFVSTAADDDSGVKYSIGILKQAISSHELGVDLKPYDLEYLSTFFKAANAVKDCISDQQHYFASNDERRTWCNTKPERMTDRRCQGPL